MSPMLLALLLAAYVPQPQPVPRPATVAGFLALCDADAKACEDRIFDLIWERSVGDQRLPFCVPEETAGPKVVAWLKARPALAAQPADPALMKALEASFPCR